MSDRLPYAPTGEDPWEMSLPDLATEIQKTRTLATGGEWRSDQPGARHERADWLADIFQARAVLQAQKTNMWLVVATWFLVGVTALLTLAAFIALS